MTDFIEIGQTVAKMSHFNVFFQDGRRQPSWIVKIWNIIGQYRPVDVRFVDDEQHFASVAVRRRPLVVGLSAAD